MSEGEREEGRRGFGKKFKWMNERMNFFFFFFCCSVRLRSERKNVFAGLVA